MAKDQSIAVKDAVHKLQLSLLEGIRHETQLFAAGTLMSRSDYEDVVIERSIANLCGYSLCNNPLPSDRPRKGRYRISLKEHKVYDLQETYMYCSTGCIVNSRTFAENLQPERCSVSNSAKIDEILKLFGELGLDASDLGKKGDLGFSELKIAEKVDVRTGEVSLEDWIGPSNAIEGYVPQIERSSKPSPSKHREGDKVSKANCVRPKKGKGKVVNEMDFTSTIIMGDQFSVPEVSSGHKPKDTNTNLEKPKEEQFSIVEASSLVQNDHESNGVLSSVVVESQFGIPKMLYDSVENVSDRGAKESKKEVVVEKMAQSNGTILKSSLKSSGERKLARSVTWADERNIGNTSNGNLCEARETSVPESAECSSSSNEEEVDGFTWLASAEACANALSQAADAVASGESDAADAVSEAGIVILPQSHDADRYSQKDEDVIEPDLVPLRWPKKPGVLNSEVFGTEDSWYDPPPEGFSLSLSSFATMWMAVFGWITSSSLAYIYGQDESSHGEFLLVNGKEYPHKVVLSDGRSSEIRVTMAGCLGRALPKVVADLRLKTPTFTIEKEVGHLLNTMSFVDALPSFKLKQWHVIALLFIDALSVCRIPGIAPHMTSGRILLQKVLDGAHVSGEEYEIMKDHVIPLGRVPQFSSQSGA